MQVSLKYATLSFCSDLTDPRGVSRPLAVVGLGVVDEDDKRRFWFFVVRNRPGDDPTIACDPLSQEILNNLPALLEKQLSEVARHGDAFLSWLHDRFRNSLHVSSLQEQQIAAESTSILLGQLGRIYETTVTSATAEQPLEVPNVNMMAYERVPALC
jgi:hypothetical protein